MTLTLQQLGTVLAALRYWQDALEYRGIPGGQEDIANGGGDFEPLTAEEIDELCDDLNCGASVPHTPEDAPEQLTPPPVKKSKPPAKVTAAMRRDHGIIIDAGLVLAKYAPKS